MKYLYIAILACSMQTISAQETYETVPIATQDLNGTARYVGMGGAMEALGADISTISSNPAGIGLFRHSSVNTSLGIVSQSDVTGFGHGNKTNISFDQIGLVYAINTGNNSAFNFAFNYHKSKNFDQILTAADRFRQETVNGTPQYISSQNKQVWQKVTNGVFRSTDDLTYSIIDNLYMKNVNTITDANNNESYVYYPATSYVYGRSSTGYIGNYDFNLSGTINSRLYWGITIGIYDVHYNNYSEYIETMDENVDGLSKLRLNDRKKITGTGYDVKLGVIFRPIETSPFRIGLSIATPTWYDLTVKGKTVLSYDMTTTSLYAGGSALHADTYDFQFYTPWKFGLSFGHTIGNFLALGASYEFADYNCCDMRIIDGYTYNSYGWNENTSVSDREMNNNIEEVLKGVSTFKVGLEFKAMPQLAIRLGYNYVSPMYSKNGMKGISNYEYVYSPGVALETSTDYTNWKATNRITCGFGYNVGKLSLDLAYQYSCTKGDFYPFNTLTQGSVAAGDTANENDNICDAVSVANKRNQLLFTIGYKF